MEFADVGCEQRVKDNSKGWGLQRHRMELPCSAMEQTPGVNYQLSSQERCCRVNAQGDSGVGGSDSHWPTSNTIITGSSLATFLPDLQSSSFSGELHKYLCSLRTGAGNLGSFIPCIPFSCYSFIHLSRCPAVFSPTSGGLVLQDAKGDVPTRL